MTNFKKSNNMWLSCLRNTKTKIIGIFGFLLYWKQVFVDPFPVAIWLFLFQPQQTVHLICIIESYTRNNSHKIYFFNSWLHFFWVAWAYPNNIIQIITFKYKHNSIRWLYLRDRPFNLKGGWGGYGFLFRSELGYLYFLSRNAIKKISSIPH